MRIFSPLFEAFVAALTPVTAEDIVVDKAAGDVWIGGKPVRELLTRLEFNLLSHLYDRRDEVCTRDDIQRALYGDEEVRPREGGNAGRVDTIVARLREKIEPDRSRPIYITSVRGRGYKLSGTKRGH